MSAETVGWPGADFIEQRGSTVRLFEEEEILQETFDAPKSASKNVW